MLDLPLTPIRSRANLESQVSRCLSMMGMDPQARRFDGDGGMVLDSSQAALFARQLEYVFTETYDVEYPENKGRVFFPVDSRVGPGDETYTYRTFDMKGKAQFADNYAESDFPDATVVASEYRQAVKSLTVGYSYDIQEMRAAAKAGIPLDVKKAQAAREVMERKLDYVCFLGDTATGLYGFFTAPGVQGSGTTVTNIDGSTYSAAARLTPAHAWTQANINSGTTTPAGIVADLNVMTAQVLTKTDGIYVADSLLLGLVDYTILAQNLSHPTYNDGTILQMVLASSAFLKSCDYSPRMDEVFQSGGAVGTNTNPGTKPAVAAWSRNARVASHIIPQEFEQFAPQPSGMRFKVPCHMRTGGLEVRYPLAIAVMGGTQG